jgi:DNA-binding PadR family transcriptional regulator
MKTISKAEVALIGLLSEGEAHAYQIEKKVEFRDMRSWTELSMSSIYKVLRKLEEKELVSSRTEISKENKTRKLYQVSKTGKQAMRQAIKCMLSQPEPLKWQMDIATYNSAVLSKKEVLAALQEYKKELEKKITGYLELDKYMKGENCPAQHRAVARRPVYVLKGELKWLDDFMQEIS